MQVSGAWNKLVLAISISGWNTSPLKVTLNSPSGFPNYGPEDVLCIYFCGLREALWKRRPLAPSGTASIWNRQGWLSEILI